MSLRLPQGKGLHKKTNRPIDHNEKYQKWSEREEVLFNKDRAGMFKLAKKYQLRAALVNEPKRKVAAQRNFEFWVHQAEALQYRSPLHQDHKDALQRHLASQWQKKDAAKVGQHVLKKYDREIDVVHRSDIEDLHTIKEWQKQAHIKALKAKQNAQDWQSLGSITGADFPRPSLEDLGRPNKESLKVPRDTTRPSKAALAIYEEGYWRKMMATKDEFYNKKGEKRLTYSQHGKECYLPPKGHATDTARLQQKVREASPEFWTKWALRESAAQPNAEAFDRKVQVRRYHNKEMSNRWDQLHWGSLAYQFERQRPAT